jgi:hypothetical protein
MRLETSSMHCERIDSNGDALRNSVGQLPVGDVVSAAAEHYPRSGITFAAATGLISKLGGYVQEAPGPVDGQDESFRVTCDGEVVGVVPVFVMNGTACSHDATSIIPYYTNERFKGGVNETICEWASEILQPGEVRSIKIMTNEALLAALLCRPEFAVSDNTRLYGYFDLRLEKEALWHSIRRSYRSLIRKGERRLRRTEYAAKDPINPEIVDFLAASPRTQFRYELDRIRHHIEKIGNNEAMLFAYWLESRLVGVVGIASWHKFAASGDYFYEMGAYDHSCGIPTHFCLYDALSYCQSNRLGNRVFLLHGVPRERPEDQAKLRNIDFYKLGYCSDTFTHPYKIVTLANR